MQRSKLLRALATPALALALAPATLFAQDASEPASKPATSAKPGVDEAVHDAFLLLLEMQENYEPDRPVGRLDEAELLGWQEKERARLAKIRGKRKAKHEWPYEGVYRVGRGVIPAGYRVGGTAIVCDALASAPSFAEHEGAREAVERAVRFMLRELRENPELEAGPKSGYDVRGWGHCYALRFFLRALREDLVDAKVAKKVEKAIPDLIECIETNEVRGEGGWNYANDRSTSPFMTGSTLITLYWAKEMGYEVDDDMIARALDGLEGARLDSGSYSYAGKARRDEPFPGACARAAIAELVLFRAGRSDAEKLRTAVDAFFEHWSELHKRMGQQGTHVPPYGIAPYYFLYGHTYAALAIEALPEEDRPALREKMQETLWRTRLPSGAWNDRIFPRSEAYCTAMALLALRAPALAPVPAWSKS